MSVITYENKIFIFNTSNVNVTKKIILDENKTKKRKKKLTLFFKELLRCVFEYT